MIFRNLFGNYKKCPRCHHFILLIALGKLAKYLEKTTLHVTSHPYLLAHTKHPFIHHLSQNHYHYTVNKSIELKTR